VYLRNSDATYFGYDQAHIGLKATNMPDRKSMNMRSGVAMATAVGLAIAANQAGAATFTLTDDVTYTGTSVLVSAVNPANGTITPTVSFGISNAYSGAPIASDFPSSVAGSGGPWNFYDDYVFTVGATGSTIQSALISFTSQFSGISDLQGRIISANGTFDAASNLGAPAGGNTVIDAWTGNSTVGGVNTVNLNGTSFGPGTYDLQIRGEVLGLPPSGAYGGSITFTPVPLPDALPLLLSGLGLCAWLWRRPLLRSRALIVGVASY